MLKYKISENSKIPAIFTAKDGCMRSSLIIALLLIAFSGYSQYTVEDQEPDTATTGSSFAEKGYRFGGNLQMQFGSAISYVEVNPLIIKDLPNQFFAYAGPLFTYYRDRLFDFTLTQYGLSTGAGKRFRKIFRLEINPIINYQIRSYHDGQSEQIWVPQLFAGAAINLQGAFVGLYFDLLENPNSLYSSPIIRVGFGF